MHFSPAATSSPAGLFLWPGRSHNVRAMTYDLDIYRSAKLLIDQHGEDAAIHAAMQADACSEKGDLEGKAVWLRVIKAIKELQRTRPRRDKPTH